MISARRAARRSGFGRGLVILAAVLAVIGAIGGILLPWSEVARAQREFALRVETSDNRFVAPGSLSMDLPAGRIFVNYFTDETFDDVRFSTSSELVFDLVVTGPDGEPIAVEHEPTQRANLPSSRPGRSAAAMRRRRFGLDLKNLLSTGKRGLRSRLGSGGARPLGTTATVSVASTPPARFRAAARGLSVRHAR